MATAKKRTQPKPQGKYDHMTLEEVAATLLNKIAWQNLKGKQVMIQPMPDIHKALYDEYYPRHEIPRVPVPCSYGCNTNAQVVLSRYQGVNRMINSAACIEHSVTAVVDMKMMGYYPIIVSLHTGIVL